MPKTNKGKQSDREAERREELRRVAADMKSLRLRLWEAHAKLPVSPREEVMLLGEEDPDFATEARSVIECIIHDAIDSAIEDLTRVARYGLAEGKSNDRGRSQSDPTGDRPAPQTDE